MSKHNPLLGAAKALLSHMAVCDVEVEGWTPERLVEEIVHAEAIEDGRVDSYCPDCGDLYCHCEERESVNG